MRAIATSLILVMTAFTMLSGSAAAERICFNDGLGNETCVVTGPPPCVEEYVLGQTATVCLEDPGPIPGVPTVEPTIETGGPDAFLKITVNVCNEPGDCYPTTVGVGPGTDGIVRAYACHTVDSIELFGQAPYACVAQSVDPTSGTAITSLCGNLVGCPFTFVAQADSDSVYTSVSGILTATPFTYSRDGQGQQVTLLGLATGYTIGPQGQQVTIASTITVTQSADLTTVTLSAPSATATASPAGASASSGPTFVQVDPAGASATTCIPATAFCPTVSSSITGSGASAQTSLLCFEETPSCYGQTVGADSSEGLEAASTGCTFGVLDPTDGYTSYVCATATIVVGPSGSYVGAFPACHREPWYDGGNVYCNHATVEHRKTPEGWDQVVVLDPDEAVYAEVTVVPDDDGRDNLCYYVQHLQGDRWGCLDP